VVVIVILASRDGSDNQAGAGAAATATVDRRNLVNREDVSGALDYADKATLAASSRARSPGCPPRDAWCVAAACSTGSTTTRWC